MHVCATGRELSQKAEEGHGESNSWGTISWKQSKKIKNNLKTE